MNLTELLWHEAGYGGRRQVDKSALNGTRCLELWVHVAVSLYPSVSDQFVTSLWFTLVAFTPDFDDGCTAAGFNDLSVEIRTRKLSRSAK